MYRYTSPSTKQKAAPRKVYEKVEVYEAKLRRVMSRLGATGLNYNWDRQSAYVSFTYKRQFYRFDHNVDKTLKTGQKLYFGTDCFAQIVLSLEDIARMVERGIYDLQKWIEGMKALPAGASLPGCLTRLGFTQEPASEEDINDHFRPLAKKYHPDSPDGNEQDFKQIEQARQEALEWWRNKKGAVERV